ncbi:ketosteroid isomerase-related protein [Acidocella sp.]|uniref:ketosteroid isomerase-related protein n=1 Tax=Acidocella sp. TaxID=50710 RepID=UPI002624580B|nr:ketosteroid isomerase-related protein [Acidocella sp.]
MPHAATLALITAYYNAFNAGDAQAMLALLADDVRHDINQGAPEHGKPAFAAFMADMQRAYAERLTDIVIIATPDGTRAAAEYVVHGQYLTTQPGLPEASGQRYLLPGGAFFTIAQGKITRVTNYYNLEDWLTQVRS